MRVRQIEAYRCDNCRGTWSRDELREIVDFHQRVDINGVVPAGECPACKALCYKVEWPVKSAHQERVEEFMKLAGQEVPAVPTYPSHEVMKLRAKLILEEALETVEALGFHAVVKSVDNVVAVKVAMERLELHNDGVVDIAEVIDGCCDLKVVTTGTLSAFGLPDELFQEEVDDNNMAKFGPGGRRREDGKWVKPPNHQPPDIQGLLRKLLLDKGVEKLGGKDEQDKPGDEAGSDRTGSTDA